MDQHRIDVERERASLPVVERSKRAELWDKYSAGELSLESLKRESMELEHAKPAEERDIDAVLSQVFTAVEGYTPDPILREEKKHLRYVDEPTLRDQLRELLPVIRSLCVEPKSEQ